MNRSVAYSLSLALSLALAGGLLAACGGGGGGGTVAPPDTGGVVPASATASPAAYVQYIGSLQDTESGLPLDTGDVVPPVTDSDAPIELS